MSALASTKRSDCDSWTVSLWTFSGGRVFADQGGADCNSMLPSVFSIGLNSFFAVRPPEHGAPRFAVSLTHVRIVRELGVARVVGIPSGLLLFARPGDGILRDPTFRRNARCLSPLQISHSREGRAFPGKQGRYAEPEENREGTDLLKTLGRGTREDRVRR